MNTQYTTCHLNVSDYSPKNATDHISPSWGNNTAIYFSKYSIPDVRSTA